VAVWEDEKFGCAGTSTVGAEAGAAGEEDDGCSCSGPVVDLTLTLLVILLWACSARDVLGRDFLRDGG
jgi:hypothetical protein